MLHGATADPASMTPRQVNFFSQLKNKDGTTTFYDSVCGKPLFVAPKGRTMAEFERESLAHGWPSFRPAEVVQANVKILEGGEMVSTCGTHLGHDIPDERGPRYCINLICIAGSPTGAAPVPEGGGETAWSESSSTGTGELQEKKRAEKNNSL